MAGFSYCTLGSGSSGNSLAVWDSEGLFLVDAGFSGKEIKKRLDAIGQAPEDITALVITHDHSDHVKGAGVLSRRYDIPIYATRKVLGGKFFNKERLSAEKEIKPDKKFNIGNFEILGFEVPHDASQTLGYRIQSNGSCMAIATDIGHMPDRVIPILKGCDGLVLESNHDIEMLKNGPYPAYLKKRILSDTGHLPNTESGDVLIKVIGPETKHVTLAHLSEENNTPEVALETVKTILSSNKVKGVSVIPASQEEVGDVVDLRRPFAHSS